MLRKFPPPGVAENHDVSSETLPPEKQLEHFRNLTSGLMDGALNVWTELWGQLDGRVASGVAILPEARRGFEPQCGWAEFLEKMWLLRYYLGLAKRLSEEDA